MGQDGSTSNLELGDCKLEVRFPSLKLTTAQSFKISNTNLIQFDLFCVIISKSFEEPVSKRLTRHQDDGQVGRQVQILAGLQDATQQWMPRRRAPTCSSSLEVAFQPGDGEKKHGTKQNGRFNEMMESQQKKIHCELLTISFDKKRVKKEELFFF